jgi:hypothetical protein
MLHAWRLITAPWHVARGLWRNTGPPPTAPLAPPRRSFCGEPTDARRFAVSTQQFQLQHYPPVHCLMPRRSATGASAASCLSPCGARALRIYVYVEGIYRPIRASHAMRCMRTTRARVSYRARRQKATPTRGCVPLPAMVGYGATVPGRYGPPSLRARSCSVILEG